MKRLINKMPIVSAVVITVLFLGISRLISEIWIFGDGVVSFFLYEAVNMLIPFLFVVLFGDISVYKKRGMRKTFVTGGYMAIGQGLLFVMLLLTALLNSETKWRTPVGIIYGVVVMLGIGFREESIFRGLIVNNIAKKYIKDRGGIFITVFASGVVFGLMHMSNIFAGVDFFSAVIQSVTAIGAGVYFAAVYLRGGSLWALIIMHALADAVSMFYSTFTFDNGTAIDAINNLSVINLAPFFILTGISLFLLRKAKCDKILENYTKTPE